MNGENRLTTYLENSFLRPLLAVPSITDISYNGSALFYEDRNYGRRKAQIDISKEEVGDFLRQIANYAEKQFCYACPILDVSFSRYRINATFLSLTRVADEKSYSFSIRLSTPGSAIYSDPSFFDNESYNLLMQALSNKESIVIGGETGSGKTELQKYLLLNLPAATRVIVIDNVEELELSRGDGSLDLTSWLVDPRFPQSDFPSLIKNALRNNPDYLLIAEARGEEMIDALNCAMTGHPIIMTMHARDIYSMPYRMARMAMMGGKNLVYEDLLGDICHHFRWLVHLEKKFGDGRIIRTLDSIAHPNQSSLGVDVIYKRGNYR